MNNSAPVLDLDPNDSGGSLRTTFRTTFTENGAPVPIADVDTSITDPDSTTLVSATITLTNPQTGDLLDGQRDVAGTIITAGYDPGTGILTLTGSATRAEYEAALQQILYSNTQRRSRHGRPPHRGRRQRRRRTTAMWRRQLISVTATNDAPVIAVDPSATYVENAAAVLLSPPASLTDADDTDLNGALVQITAGSFPGDGDILTVGGDTSGT